MSKRRYTNMLESGMSHRQIEDELGLEERQPRLSIYIASIF